MTPIQGTPNEIVTSVHVLTYANTNAPRETPRSVHVIVKRVMFKRCNNN